MSNEDILVVTPPPHPVKQPRVVRAPKKPPSGSFFLSSSVSIRKSHNIIFTQIDPNLHLNQHQRLLTGIFQ